MASACFQPVMHGVVLSAILELGLIAKLKRNIMSAIDGWRQVRSFKAKQILAKGRWFDGIRWQISWNHGL